MEDFVTFEIAKKLKEKGFSLNKEDIEFIGCRLIFSDECTIKRISTIGAYNKEYFGENIDCPTIQQVLKWLREKKIHLVVDIEPNGYFFIINYNITTTFDDKYEFDIYNSLSCYNDDKQAFIAGIEYVLDNLI